VTKVVTFGAFVEILPGVEGLVHISELAQHHVENPREVVSQGDTVNVRILEVDAERRRLSLSLKRVEDGMPIQPGPGEDAVPPSIDLSEDVFSDQPATQPALVEELVVNDVDPSVLVEPEADAEPGAVVEVEIAVEEPPAAADEPEAVAEPAPGSDEPAPE